MIIITKSHYNCCSVGVTELCLLNLLILIVFCVILPFCVLWELVTCDYQESHVYSWNLGENYLVHFLIFWNLPRLTGEISKFQKSAIGKFIPNFPFKHVITSTYTKRLSNHCLQKQPPRGVLSEKVFLEFRKIHRKTPVSESLF